MAVVVTSYYRQKPGGFCTRLFRAIEALLSEGHEVHYLSLAPFPITHANCHFHRFPWPEKHSENLLFWAFFHLLAPILLTYIGIKYKVTHTFAFGPNYGFILQPLHFIASVPLTLFIRADTLKNHQLSGHSKWLIQIDKVIEGFAIYRTRIYGVSESLTKQLVDRHSFLKPRLAATLRNNIESIPKHCQRARNKRAKLHIGCVGILEERKNQSFLLKLLSQLDDSKIQLELYGIGPQETQLKKIAENLNLKDCVHFMGWRERSAIWENVELLLMPSLHEGAPNAILEALSEGIPILASDIPEHREILPAANLISLDNPTNWQKQIVQIIEDPERTLYKLCLNQRPFAERLHFDWNKAICKAITSH